MGNIITACVGLSAYRLFKISHIKLLSTNEIRNGLRKYYRYFSGETRCFRGLRKYGMFQVWTKEFIEIFADFLKKRIKHEHSLILDVGAGNGLLTKWLKVYGLNIVGVDNQSGEWHFKRAPWIFNMDYQKALEKFEPEIVISSWMPPYEDWTSQFRNTPSVQSYILIGEPTGDYPHLTYGENHKLHINGCGKTYSWEVFGKWEKEEILELRPHLLSYVEFLNENKQNEINFGHIRKSLAFSFKRI